MHPDDIRAYFDSDDYTPGYGHAAAIAELVLERLPNDTYAWLRSEHAAAEFTGPSEDLEPEDAVYWPTQLGRDLCARWRAECALFGREITS